MDTVPVLMSVHDEHLQDTFNQQLIKARKKNWNRKKAKQLQAIYEILKNVIFFFF